MKISLTSITVIILLFGKIFAQSNPVILDPKITIQRIMTVKNGVIRVAKDPISHNLFYVLTSGKIYEVLQPSGGPAHDSLVDSTAHHSVQYVQGFAFFDSTLYVSGNNKKDSTKTAGIIARGKLQPNGTRKWDTLMITEFYQTSDYFDHLFSGLVVSPAGDTIYIASGARGDHGEIQTRYGAYPNLRNVAMTSNIFTLPTYLASPILLPNDSNALMASGYLYCRGVRNHFDMAFDADGNLFGVENSGDRDHHEEMNWLQKNHHYGFPWKMGDTDNPQQFPSFNPATDKLINHFCRAWRFGFWNNDPTYPQPPLGLKFDDPIQNFGPDCDKYRDTLGNVHDASDSSISMGTFTAHRSPLGLVFDRAQILSAPFNGDAFMLSWTKGLDSCGCTTVPDTGVGPFVDPSQDLVHLDLTFDSLVNNFRLNATRVIADFQHPVDADIDSNKIYVVENGFAGTSGLYVVTLPALLPCNPTVSLDIPVVCDPGTNTVSVNAFGQLPNDFYWYNSTGTLLYSDTGLTGSDTLHDLSQDRYYIVVSDSGHCGTDTLTFDIPDSLYFNIDSVSHTSCIGCNDGAIYFSVDGGLAPYNIQATSGTVLGNTITGLLADTFSVCVIDQNGCNLCRPAIILEDPTGTGFISNKGYLLFPNPASNTATLHFNETGKLSVRLLNMNGQLIQSLVKEKQISGSFDLQIDCKDSIKGSYLVEIKINDNVSYKKLIITD